MIYILIKIAKYFLLHTWKGKTVNYIYKGQQEVEATSNLPSGYPFYNQVVNTSKYLQNKSEHFSQCKNQDVAFLHFLCIT